MEAQLQADPTSADESTPSLQNEISRTSSEGIVRRIGLRKLISLLFLALLAVVLTSTYFYRFVWFPKRSFKLTSTEPNIGRLLLVYNPDFLGGNAKLTEQLSSEFVRDNWEVASIQAHENAEIKTEEYDLVVLVAKTSFAQPPTLLMKYLDSVEGVGTLGVVLFSIGGKAAEVSEKLEVEIKKQLDNERQKFLPLEFEKLDSDLIQDVTQEIYQFYEKQAKELDKERIAILQLISRWLNGHYGSQKSLPTDLSEIMAAEGLPQAYLDREPYSTVLLYHEIGEKEFEYDPRVKHYSLCTTFFWNFADFGDERFIINAEHPKGIYCYYFDADSPGFYKDQSEIIDEIRMDQIDLLGEEIKAYYKLHSALPDSYEEIDFSNLQHEVKDPKTGEQYIYEKSDNSTFSICGQFTVYDSGEFASIDTLQWYSQKISGEIWICKRFSLSQMDYRHSNVHDSILDPSFENWEKGEKGVGRILSDWLVSNENYMEVKNIDYSSEKFQEHGSMAVGLVPTDVPFSFLTSNKVKVEPGFVYRIESWSRIVAGCVDCGFLGLAIFDSSGVNISSEIQSCGDYHKDHLMNFKIIAPSKMYQYTPFEKDELECNLPLNADHIQIKVGFIKNPNSSWIFNYVNMEKVVAD